MRTAFKSWWMVLLIAAPLIVHAQSAGSVQRIGYLSPGSSTDQSDPASGVSALRQGLRELGYVEGQNLVIESRYSDGDANRLSALALELVRAKVAVIVTWGPGIQPAKRATKTVPIVMASTMDAVGAGHVDSLVRPGGNVTGLTMISTELMGKRFELLKQALPSLTRVALLGIGGPGTDLVVGAAQTAAKTLAIRLQVLRVSSPADFNAAFARMTEERAGALYVVENPPLTVHLDRILELARMHRLPTMFGQPRFAEAGALIAYGPSLRDMNRRAAAYVDRILKGAKPGDLPVEQPTKFDLVVNLKIAKTLGITIPSSIVARADQVIE